jgi:Protein of unknown function (DUF2786)
MTVERENVLNKIRALLAKTMNAGCTEAEAMTALGKAQAMRDAYQVTEAELNLTREEKAIFRREPPGTKDPHRIKWFLLSAVSEFCNCTGFRQMQRDGGGIIFCGLPSDAQLASWLLDTLTGFVQAELVNGRRAQQRGAPRGDQGLRHGNHRTDQRPLAGALPAVQNLHLIERASVGGDEVRGRPGQVRRAGYPPP